MINGAWLQIDNNCIGHILNLQSSEKFFVSEDNVEVSGVIVEIVAPYLNSKHKMVSRICIESIRERISSISIGPIGSDNNFIERINDLIVENYYECND